VARHDLSTVNAALRLFKLNREPQQFPAYVSRRRLWKRAEIVAVCREVRAKGGPLDTRKLALRVINAKGLDANYKVMRQTVAARIVQAPAVATRRTTIQSSGRRNGVRVWTSVHK
jgi:hypothetical protein